MKVQLSLYSTTHTHSLDLHEILNFYLYIFTSAVCIGFLNKFSKRLKEKELDPGNQDKSELELRKACREAKGKDERFVSHCKKDPTVCNLSRFTFN